MTYNKVTNEHDLDFIFSVPLVGDRLVYRDENDKSKGYDIEKGEHNIIVKHKNVKKMSDEKVSLINTISNLLGEKKSYGDISKQLNEQGIKTIRGGKWSRQSVRRFFDYGSKELNFVEVESKKK